MEGGARKGSPLKWSLLMFLRSSSGHSNHLISSFLLCSTVANDQMAKCSSAALRKIRYYTRPT